MCVNIHIMIRALFRVSNVERDNNVLFTAGADISQISETES